MSKLPFFLEDASGMDEQNNRSEYVGDPAPDIERPEEPNELGDRGATRREMELGMFYR